MTLVRWNPFREVAAMQRMMDRLMDETWNNVQPVFNASALALDVHESADNYVVSAVLPGITPDKIDITFNDRTLTISAEIPQPEIPEGVRVLMNERIYGKFSRSVSLATPVDSDKIAAEYVNGVLTLTLPKAESAKPRQIPVRTTISSN